MGVPSGLFLLMLGRALASALVPVSAREGGVADARSPKRSRMLPQACLIRSPRPIPAMFGDSPRPAVGVGEVGRTGDGIGGLSELELADGGARLDDKMGSEEPVRRDAAVAAAATLQ
jgi:hypothetical protein